MRMLRKPRMDLSTTIGATLLLATVAAVYPALGSEQQNCKVYCAGPGIWLGPQICNPPGPTACCINANCSTGLWAGACCSSALDCEYGTDGEGNPTASCVVDP